MSAFSKASRLSVRTLNLHVEDDEENEGCPVVAHDPVFVASISWARDPCTDDDYEAILSNPVLAQDHVDFCESRQLDWDLEDEAAEQSAYLTWWESNR